MTVARRSFSISAARASGGWVLRIWTLATEESGRRRALDADIDVALALGVIGELVGASDHLGREAFRVLLVNVPEDGPHVQRANAPRRHTVQGA
jgi:hypothetical protein